MARFNSFAASLLTAAAIVLLSLAVVAAMQSAMADEPLSNSVLCSCNGPGNCNVVSCAKNPCQNSTCTYDPVKKAYFCGEASCNRTGG